VARRSMRSGGAGSRPPGSRLMRAAFAAHASFALLLAGGVPARATDAVVAPASAEFSADADADPYAGPAPMSVRFSATASNASGRVSYAWSFDDGETSTERKPVHVYRKHGWYEVTMNARDEAGHSYRMNLLLHAWRPRDWTRMRNKLDVRIVQHAAGEL